MENRHIKYSEIKRINKGSGYKTNKIIEKFIKDDKLVKLSSLHPEDQLYLKPTYLNEKDFKYFERDFESPIGTREVVAWSIAFISIIFNMISIFSK